MATSSPPAGASSAPSASRKKLGLSSLPNKLTTLRLVLSFVLFVCIWMHYWLACLVLFAVAAFTDWLDGYYARKYDLTSPLGRVYDPLVDKVLISGCFTFLITVPDAYVGPWFVTLIVAREFLVTGLRGLLEKKNVSFGADRWGKFKMIFQCFSLIWIFAVLAYFQATPLPYAYALVTQIALYITLFLTVASGLNYIYKAWPHIR